MLPLRVLTPFLFIAASFVLVVVLTLLILGNNMDQQARKGLQQQLRYAFIDQQQRLQQQMDQLQTLHETLPAYSFMQVLIHQLDQQCLFWLGKNADLYQGRCPDESNLPLALLHQLALSRETAGLHGKEPTFFYQYRETQDGQLWLVQPFDQDLLDAWQETYQLPPLVLKTHAIIISGEAQYPVTLTDGSTHLYIHYPLPRPGQELVQSALLPLLLVMLLMVSVGLFAAHQLWRLMIARERSETRLRNVIDLVPHMIYARDADGFFVLANKATARFFHSTPEKLLGQNLAELTGDNQAYELVLRRERALLMSGDTVFMEEEVLPGKDAPSIWQTSKLHFNDTDGKAGILSVSIDITAQREQQQQLMMLSSALENSGSAVLICDWQGQVTYSNARFRNLTGKQSQELLHHPLEQLLRGSLSRIQLRAIMRSLRQSSQWRGELKLQMQGHHHYWLMVSVSPLQLDSRQPDKPHFVLVAEDITELKLTHQKLEQLALYDTLTGLENRRLFKQRLNKAIKLAKRQKSLCALLYLDLDHFKRINDTLGHDAGDQLLVTVADRLRTCVRDSDSIARLGGDEFTLLLHDINHPDAAAQVARKITEQLALPIQLGNKSVIVTTSVGITLAPTDSEIPSELMKNADLAMYRAKTEGRNTYQFFTPEMNTHANRLLEVETELRDALQEQNFQVYYQPQVDLDLGRVVGFEALVRWQHPVRGLISPLEFIPIAEETGLIVELGHQVLEQACRDLALLNQQLDHRCYVAVNLSPRQLKDTGLPAYVDQLLTRHNLSPRYLELEITESTLMDQMDLSLPILHQIEQLGIALSIDDFGTGYSSLSYLKQLPVHSLKIDRSFVQDIPGDRDDMAIVSAICAMAAKLNLDVVAEGVEQLDQLEFLRSSQCNLVQGYYFSKPLPIDQLVAQCQKIAQQLG